MPLRAGEDADYQRKGNGNASRAKHRRTEIYSIPGGCILQLQAARVSNNFSGTVGNGRPARPSVIPDISPFRVLWANTTASLCLARWFCVEDPALHPRTMCVRHIGVSFSQQLGGNSLEYVWRAHDYLLSSIRRGEPRLAGYKRSAHPRSAARSANAPPFSCAVDVLRRAWVTSFRTHHKAA